MYPSVFKNMKNKILFWIDGQLLHFGLSKYLSDNFDCDLYSIIDINDITKKFFLSQKIVNFKKSWYYRDYVTNLKNKVDYEYLELFEKKFKINLWQIASTEVIFSEHYPYYNFTESEILRILQEECKLFENILEEVRPDFFIVKTTDWHHNHLFQQMCKLYGVKILMTWPPRIGKSVIISEQYDFFENTDIIPTSIKKLEELQKFLHKDDFFEFVTSLNSNFRSSKILKLKASLQFLLFICSKNYRNYYANFGQTRLKVIKTEFLKEIQALLQKNFLNKISFKNFPKNEKFLLFPLSVVPERSLIDSPYYLNQIELITLIAKSLPIGYKLYVKEHPSMYSKGWRSKNEYRKILHIPNVRLIHPSTNPRELIKNCSLVTTIGGTAGLEASFYEKPVIIFSDTSYSFFSSVFRLKNIEDLPYAIREYLQKKPSLKELNVYVELIKQNSISMNYTGLIIDIHNRFLYGGFNLNAEITESEMIEYLKIKREPLEVLASGIVKKIKQLNQLKENN